MFKRSILLSLILILAVVNTQAQERQYTRLKGYYRVYQSTNSMLSYFIDAFLWGENRSEKLPDSYRKQLIANLRQFVEQQKKENEGIDSVSLASSVFSEKDSTASAFLLLHYGDKTTEQVVVPMLKKHGV